MVGGLYRSCKGKPSLISATNIPDATLKKWKIIGPISSHVIQLNSHRYMESPQTPMKLLLRRIAHYPVRFRGATHGADGIDGAGVTIDLSLRGCRIKSHTPVCGGIRLALTIKASETTAAIEVKQAFVRWVAGEEFGLTFESIAPDQLKRLELTIQHLPYVPDRTRTLIDEPAKQAWMQPDSFGKSKL